MKRLILAIFLNLVFSVTAIGETTVSDLIARASIGPGEYTSPSLQLTNCAHIIIQLNPNTTDWKDETILLTYSVETSHDGGASWQHFIGGSLPGKSYRKDGSMPAIELWEPPDGLYRAKLVINKRFRIGVTGTVTTY